MFSIISLAPEVHVGVAVCFRSLLTELLWLRRRVHVAEPASGADPDDFRQFPASPTLAAHHGPDDLLCCASQVASLEKPFVKLCGCMWQHFNLLHLAEHFHAPCALLPV